MAPNTKPNYLPSVEHRNQIQIIMNNLKDRKIAVLATNGFEEVELTKPVERLKEEGATVHIVSPEPGKIKSWREKNWGEEFEVDKTVGEADSNEYDGLLLPGGVINPDHLRRSKEAVQFVRDFFDQGKPVASICHGPQVLVEADVLDGRTLTSFHSVKTDVKNAGGNWVDEEVVVDAGLVTSRSPEDLEAFMGKMVEEFREGVHAGQQA